MPWVSFLFHVLFEIAQTLGMIFLYFSKLLLFFCQRQQLSLFLRCKQFIFLIELNQQHFLLVDKLDIYAFQKFDSFLQSCPFAHHLLILPSYFFKLHIFLFEFLDFYHYIVVALLGESILLTCCLIFQFTLSKLNLKSQIFNLSLHVRLVYSIPTELFLFLLVFHRQYFFLQVLNPSFEFVTVFFEYFLLFYLRCRFFSNLGNFIVLNDGFSFDDLSFFLQHLQLLIQFGIQLRIILILALHIPLLILQCRDFLLKFLKLFQSPSQFEQILAPECDFIMEITIRETQAINDMLLFVDDRSKILMPRYYSLIEIFLCRQVTQLLGQQYFGILRTFL